MIDLKTLASIKNLAERMGYDNSDEMLNAYYVSALKPEVVTEMLTLAMRYLALRERKVALQRGMDGITSIYGVWLDGIGLDAAADRLIQEMLK